MATFHNSELLRSCLSELTAREAHAPVVYVQKRLINLLSLGKTWDESKQVASFLTRSVFEVEHEAVKNMKMCHLQWCVSVSPSKQCAEHHIACAVRACAGPDKCSFQASHCRHINYGRGVDGRTQTSRNAQVQCFDYDSIVSLSSTQSSI